MMHLLMNIIFAFLWHLSCYAKVFPLNILFHYYLTLFIIKWSHGQSDIFFFSRIVCLNKVSFYNINLVCWNT